MGILDAYTRSLHLVKVAVLTRVAVNIMYAEVTDRASFEDRILSNTLLGFHGTCIALPCYSLRPVSMVQIEVDDCSMCETVSLNSMFDADVDVVDPAETRRPVCRTMVARRSNAHERFLAVFALTCIIEYCIHRLTDTAQSTLQSIQRFLGKIEVSLMQARSGLSTGPRGCFRTCKFPAISSQLRLGSFAHGLQLLHPTRAMYGSNDRRCDGNGS